MSEFGLLGDRFQSTLPSVVERLARESPGRPAVRMLGDEAVSAGELWQVVSSVAAALAQLGLEPGGRVAVMLPNCLEMVQAFFGVTLAGAVFVPMNTAWRGNSLSQILDDSEPTVLIVHASRLPEMLSHAAQRPCIRAVVVVGESIGDGAAFITFSSLTEAGPSLSRPPIRAEDLAMLLYTSGTTGASKGNMMSHRASLWMAAAASDTLGYLPSDVIHSCLPLFHANALLCGLLGGLLHGSEFVISPRFTASGFWGEVRDVEATHTALLGSMIPLLVAQPPRPSERDHNVKVAYCAPLPEPVAEFERRFGLKCASTYGLTDANIFTLRPADESGMSSCGTAASDWELAVVDDDDLPVARGGVGELVGRPRLPFIASSGYWRKPQATTELWRNLWCHSGDLLREDEQGLFHFVDRKKDAIRKGGENISSYEVEQVLLSHPAVTEAAVFGVPSDLSEDDVMAAIVVGDGVQLDYEEVFKMCVRELPYFAVPRYIEVVQQIPRTENHRVRKAELRARGVSQSTWDAGPISRSGFEAVGLA